MVSQRRQKRTERGKRLLRYTTLASLEKTFTDEKIFKLQALNNKQNNRIYVVNLSDALERNSEKSKFAMSKMVFAGVSKLLKTSIHFLTPGTKINSSYYCNEVLSQPLPEIKQLSNGDCIFQQDAACSHTLNVMLAYLESIAVNFWNQILGHVIALTSILVIMLSGVHWKPKSGSIINFRLQLLKIRKNKSLKNGMPYCKMLFPEQSTLLETMFTWSLRRMVGI